MRYVLINELYSMGGTEVQGKREKSLMESHGHEVLYITFDNTFNSGIDPKDHNHYNLKTEYSTLFTRLYRIFEDKKLTQKVRKLIDDFSPDFIHINNAVQHALVIYRAVVGYPVFQTLRDYTAVCPTGLCVDSKWEICEGIKYNKCLKKCMPKEKKMMFLYWYYIQKKIMNYRKKYISQFACPSQTLTDYCNNHDLNTECLNNPFDFTAIDNQKKNLKDNKKVYMYYGIIASHKGINELLNAFSIFSEGKDVELVLAGKCLPGMEKTIDEYTTNPKIKYKGVLPYSAILELLQTVDVVVVPSLWMENYPNTVLEGLCCECIVTASSRGGMKELIRNENLIFDVMNNEDIIQKLEYTYTMNKEEVRKITARNKQYVLENNSLNKYYERFMKLAEKCISG